MTASPRPTAALLAAVEAEGGPVRPLPAPALRALALGPWVAGALLLVVAGLGPRSDSGLLGRALTWGPPLLGVAAGLALVAAGLAAAVPGRGLPRLGAWAAAGLALAGFLAQAWLVERAAPPPASTLAGHGAGCFVLQLLLGLSALAVAAALVARARPLRPLRAAALCGTGTGLMAAAVYQLHCPAAGLGHVLGTHGGAALAVALVALLLARAWEGREARAMAARLAAGP